jgi:hypothetical protein
LVDRRSGRSLIFGLFEEGREDAPRRKTRWEGSSGFHVLAVIPVTPVVVSLRSRRLIFLVGFIVATEGIVIRVIISMRILRASESIPILTIFEFFTESTLGVTLGRSPSSKAVWRMQVLAVGARSFLRRLAIMRVQILVWKPFVIRAAAKGTLLS